MEGVERVQRQRGPAHRRAAGGARRRAAGKPGPGRRRPAWESSSSWSPDASSLDFPHESFDAAVSRWGIIFEPDAEAAAGRIRGFLKPGARRAISSWGEPDQVPGRFTDHPRPYEMRRCHVLTSTRAGSPVSPIVSTPLPMIGATGFERATPRPPAGGLRCPMRPVAAHVSPASPASGDIGHIARCVRYQGGTRLGGSQLTGFDIASVLHQCAGKRVGDRGSRSRGSSIR
jgi:hypothetical protein